MKKERSSSNGLGFGSVLFLIFLVLKLTHYIDWSWWLITAPLWLPVILAGTFLIIISWVNYK